MTWIKIIGALLLVGGMLTSSFYAGWWVRERDMLADQEKARADTAERAIADMKAAAEQMNTAAVNYSKYRLALHSRLEGIRNEIARIEKPLPDGCRPDDQRRRLLEEAIGETNRATTGR